MKVVGGMKQSDVVETHDGTLHQTLGYITRVIGI